MSGHKRRHTVVGDVARAVMLMAVFAAVAMAMESPGVTALFDIDHLRQALQGRGWRGTFAFVAVAGLVTAVGIPRLWISVAAGTLYGAVEGSAVAQVASLAGAVVNFYLARWMLRGPVERRMTPRMRRWYDRFNENGFRWLLFLRLFPLSNASLTNTIGGISAMRARDFFAATFIGYLPLTIVFALFGSSAAKQSGVQLAIAGGVFLAVMLARLIYEKYRGSAGMDDDDESGATAAIQSESPAPSVPAHSVKLP